MRSTALAAVALGLATVVVYAPALDGELQLDDVHLLEDPAVLSLSPYGGGGGWRAAAAGGRPLTTFTFAVNHALSGFERRPLHAVNVGLHLCATALAFLLARTTLRRMGGSPATAAALAVAALFALHPVQTQAVAYVSQRAEVLAGALGLGALALLLASDAARTGARRWALRAAALGTFVLALAAKPSAAPVPAAWLLHAAFFPVEAERSSHPLRRIMRRLPAALPFLALPAAALVGGLLAVRGRLDAGGGIPWLEGGAYALTQLRVVPTYLGLLFWPAGLHVDWSMRPSAGLLDPPSTLAGGLLLGALVVAALLAERRTRSAHAPLAWTVRLAAFGACWFLLFLAPSSSVVPLADLLEEHRLYLPTFGIAAAVAAGAAFALARLPGRARVASAALATVAVLALATAAHARSRTWATRLALWSDAAAKSPGKARVRVKLGEALADGGRLDEALEQYRQALRLASDHSISPTVVTLRSAATLSYLRRHEEAAGLLEGLVERGHRGTDVLHNLALVYVDMGRLDEAEALARELLADGSRRGRAHDVLGLVHLARGDVAAAREAFASAAALAPDDASVLLDLADAEARLGRLDVACALAARVEAGRGRGGLLEVARRRAAALGCGAR